MRLLLVLALVAAALSCEYGGRKYRDREEWVVDNAFKMKCKIDHHMAWSVHVTACLTPDRVEVPVNQTKTVGQYDWECKISGGYPYLKKGSFSGTTSDCTNGRGYGVEWTDSSLRFRCEKGGRSRFIGCVASDGSVIPDGYTRTIRGYDMECKKHADGTVTLRPSQTQELSCRDSEGVTRRNGETWTEGGRAIKECRNSKAVIIGWKVSEWGYPRPSKVNSAPFVPTSPTEAEVLNSICAERLNKGDDNCTSYERPAIMWHMDKETLTCLAFKYTGCGGNTNRFATKEQCQRTCLPMDFHTCPANSPPAKRADNTSHCNGNSTASSLTCPRGSVCKMGYGAGLCCDTKTAERVNANYEPTCSSGKRPYKSEQFGVRLIHLGKTCSHDFCPAGSSCHKGDYFAYCCQ